MNARVFIIHRATINSIDKFSFTKAEKYGRIVKLFQNEEAQKDPNALIKELTHELWNINDSDFILCTGDPLMLILTGIALNGCSMWNILKILKWDKYTKDYNISLLNKFVYTKGEG